MTQFRISAQRTQGGFSISGRPGRGLGPAALTVSVTALCFVGAYCFYRRGDALLSALVGAYAVFMLVGAANVAAGGGAMEAVFEGATATFSVRRFGRTRVTTAPLGRSVTFREKEVPVIGGRVRMIEFVSDDQVVWTTPPLTAEQMRALGEQLPALGCDHAR